MKEYKKTIIATCIVTILPMIVGIILWNKLPDTIATHFGADGEVNGWSNKSFVVFGMPIILAIVQFLTAGITLSDPKKQNLSKTVMNIVLWIVPACSWICAIASYGYSFGMEFDVGKIVYIFLGVLFVVIGNYLPKCKQSYTVGIKTPWALDNNENWNKTHRLAGKIWVVAGIVMIIDYFLNIGEIIGIVIGIAVVVPYVYSFVLYKKGNTK